MNRIVIILALITAFIFRVNAQEEQQSFTLTGTVFDEHNETIPGANVYLKDRPGVGVSTDIDGNFRLTVNMYDILVVSFLGYDLFEHRIIKKETDLKITLKASTEQIEEVVVVGLGTQRKISVAGAISTIDPKQLDVPATSLANALGGRIPGIIAVQRSGEPGRNTSEFWVRGIGTFGASSGALILIDGLEGDLEQIDAADIETFSVLKDASATAVYGSRGANGVVLITTKRGVDQKLKISGRANMTISQLKRLPKYLRAYEYAELANEAAVASGMTPIYDDMKLEIIKYGLDPDLYPDIDWQDVILNPTSLQQTYYVSAQGGGAVARYFASIGISNESSAYKSLSDSKYANGVGVKQYDYRLNLNISLTKTTEVNIGASGHQKVYHSPSMGREYSGGSLTNWIWESQAKTTPVMYPLRYSSGELPASGEQNNIPPHILLNYTGSQKEVSYRNMVNLSIEQDFSMIAKGLRGKILIAWDNQNRFGESRFKMPAMFYATERNNNGQLKLTPRVNEAAVQYSSGTWTWEKLNLDANINYDQRFGDHTVGGLLFYRQEETSSSGASDSMNAIPRRYQNFSGRFTYGFRDTYFGDFNFGITGSENFQPGRQYGFFPSGAIAWVPTSYKFIQQNIPWLQFLKLRGSYGIVGNDNISNTRFPYLTLIKEGEDTVNLWGGVGSLTEERVGADNLMWEKAKKLDIGIDVRLFNDKFNFTLDYFKDTRDGIFQQRTQVPDYVGVITMPYGNVGSMKSWGGDGQLEYFQEIGKDFYLTLRSNFTLSKNKVINSEEALRTYPYLIKNGYANNVQRGFIALGLFKDQEDIDMSPSQFGNVRPGDIKYKDVNGDGKITDDDKVPLFAYANVPQMMYGLGAEIRYKNWTLNFLLKGTGRNKFLYGGENGGNFDGYIPFNNGYQGNVMEIVYDQKNRWTSAEYSGLPNTENPNARFPRLYYGNNQNNTKPSTFWMGDARYLRIQELSVSYRLKVPALQRVLGVQSMDILVMGENLAVWDSVKLFDPQQAQDSGKAYPIPARYALQLYVHF